MKARSVIESGICGFTTTVEVDCTDYECSVEIQSDCPNMPRYREELRHVSAFTEMSYRDGRPQAFETAERVLPHTACPVPVGIVKAVEVAAELAYPRDVAIKVTKVED
jgi:hypothetical protein